MKNILLISCLLQLSAMSFGQNFVTKHKYPVTSQSNCTPLLKTSCNDLFFLDDSNSDTLCVYNENTQQLNRYPLNGNIYSSPVNYSIRNNKIFCEVNCNNVYFFGSPGIIQYTNNSINTFSFPVNFAGGSPQFVKLSYLNGALYISTEVGMYVLQNGVITQCNLLQGYFEGMALSTAGRILLTQDSLLYWSDGNLVMHISAANLSVRNIKIIGVDGLGGAFLMDTYYQKFFYLNAQLVLNEIPVPQYEVCENNNTFSFYGVNSRYTVFRNKIMTFYDVMGFSTLDRYGKILNYNFSIGTISGQPHYLFNNNDSLYFLNHRGNALLGGDYFTLNPTFYQPVLSSNSTPICKALDLNNVSSLVLNRGDANWDLSSNPKFEVPKNSGKSTIFANAIWIGGIDDNNVLHQAAMNYRQGGCDFWPGTLDTITGQADSINAGKFDKVWKISKSDVQHFRWAYQNGMVQNGTYVPPTDFTNWPVSGTGNYSKNLAPFFDNNHDGFYNYLDGDYPIIKGDQAVYTIFNDALANHSESNGLKLGVEVHLMAYEYYCDVVGNVGDNVINNTVYYSYEIINRSNSNYHNVSIGLFQDMDLGNYADDYVGCRPKYNYAFTYNGDADDEGTAGYGINPPIQNTIVLNGPLAPSADGIDNDNDGQIDEINERCLMTSFLYFNNNASITGEPGQDTLGFPEAEQFYNYMNSTWKDNSHVMYGGDGWGPSGTTLNIPTNFMYDGVCENPNAPFYGQVWTESSVGNVPYDRRMVQGCSGFDLPSKQKVDFEFAEVFVWDSTIAWSLDTGAMYFKNNHNNVKRVIDIYNGNMPSTCVNIYYAGIKEEKDANIISVSPNPTNNVLNINMPNNRRDYIISVYNTTGSLVLSQNFNTQLDVGSLSPGLYMLQLNDKKGSVENLKFVKE